MNQNTLVLPQRLIKRFRARKVQLTLNSRIQEEVHSIEEVRGVIIYHKIHNWS